MVGVWIRSQDKKQLHYCRGLYIGQMLNYSRTSAEEGDYTIEVVVCHGHAQILGFYPNKERALQVLDKVQNHLKTCILGDATVHVFEMPEE